MTRWFDISRELTTGLQGRDEAWQFIRGYAEHWAEGLSEGDGEGDGDGWGELEIAGAAGRLGVALPAALREAYALLGRRPDLTSNNDVLLDPDELYLDDEGTALVFRHENQGAASWGILVADLAHPDPPVVVRADLADKQAERWEPWLDRLSLALVEIVLSESLHAPEELCDVRCDLTEDDLARVGRHAAPLPFPNAPGTHWYLAPDALLRDDGATLLVRSRTEKALDRIRDDLPGDWLNDLR
ncbi:MULTISPECIES: SMI1/KNR4 family protein [unclassified Streptomyces]|uniref:SMI1/KNR4 family protein n=1 Tax=unclassified Streptomyces TaxID=2593676 RepID=UPI002DD81118|nr:MULTISPECIES: SMI1/KNR4 family protein [unclassified Streptomyces]WSA94625.1 SMI1/KNR4 family protein [Streptomyces sp. NBC_01795]WSB79045.1 SMI1/KNR4 family protein [Streptomyces sp. NBC_01775]WSS12755.1 SMI1/KNR4 family protein [Streptomyces sp. NBC_01186]WSS41538.1 SMI1/KNR4 family protein [Streptomyces sp. NBC_01187]